MLNYEDAATYLSTLHKRGWRLGLDRMEEFARRCGVSEDLGSGHTKFLHIAGTNGKGSVTAYLQSILVESGLRTGAYYSPYVVDLRERIQFGRNLISKDDFARLMEKTIPIIESMDETELGSVTEFEVKTALALMYWKEMACDFVALEVGLGGRLDATNIVHPAACGIVSIGYDHMAILGNTLGEIATEKAGIIKPGIPVMTGDLPSDALEAVAHKVADVGCPWWRWGGEVVLEGTGAYTVHTPAGSIEDLVPGLEGAPQPHNMAVAVGMILAAAVPTTPEDIRRGVASATLPGRFQRLEHAGHLFVLDGAHNGESALQLATSLQRTFAGRKFTLITGMVDGHDPDLVYQPLWEFIDRTFVAPIDFYRALPPIDLVSRVPNGTPTASVVEAIDAALAHDSPILVTGSFYLVGDVLRALEGRRSVD